MRTLDSLAEGDSARVLEIEAADTPDGQRLLSMGLVPGARVRVDQRWPAVVVSVGETVIAMETAVARGVLVEA